MVYMKEFMTDVDICDWMTELLTMMRLVLDSPIYDENWFIMLNFQSKIYQKTIQQLLPVITRTNDTTALQEFFRFAVSFITQKCLQPENYTTRFRVGGFEGASSDLRSLMSQSALDTWQLMDPDIKQLPIFSPELIPVIIQGTFVTDKLSKQAFYNILFDIFSTKNSLFVADSPGEGTVLEFVLRALDMFLDARYYGKNCHYRGFF